MLNQVQHDDHTLKQDTRNTTNKKATLFKQDGLTILIDKIYFLPKNSSDTVSFLRPFALRDAKTLLPFLLDIRSRKPCLFFLLRTDG